MGKSGRRCEAWEFAGLKHGATIPAARDRRHDKAPICATHRINPETRVLSGNRYAGENNSTGYHRGPSANRIASTDKAVDEAD